MKTKSNNILILVLAVIIGFTMIPTFSWGESVDTMKILREKIKADKKLLIAKNMNLTKAEAEKFWPLYEDYQKAFEAVMDRYRTLIDVFAENYQKMTNEKATSLLDKSLDIEAELVRVRTTYVPKFRQALLATKVARYYQIENKIQAVLRYDAATRIPLMTH